MKSQPRYHRGDRIANRYLVHQALMGGMGEVYLCLDLEENYPLALKTFQQRYLTNTQRLRRAFEQEVATWVALENHPNVVHCFYMDTCDNQPFMVLEWIAGEEGKGTDLRGWLRHGPLDLKLALQIAIDVCHGLLHAQAKRPGLVHRDLKPENILIAKGGLAQITDFGLAQIVATAGLAIAQDSVIQDSRQSLVGGQGIIGTPAYMAPEQWHNELLDVRTDIYAIGCILYELLTGTIPFPIVLASPDPQGVRTWLRTLQHAHEHAPVTGLPTQLPAGLNALVQRCLAKTPSARYPDLAALLSALTSLYQAQFAQAPRLPSTLSSFTAIEYSNRGATYAKLGQYEAALADFAQAITLDPNHASAYMNRGNTYTALGQHEAALADFTQALAIDPHDGSTYTNRGNTYAALGQHEAALADFTQALAIDPTFVPAYFNRGNTYAALGQRDAALADYTYALQRDPTFAQAYYNRGLTYDALGHYETALADYTYALQLDPTDAQAYYNRGGDYAALGQHEAALADFTRALTLDPNHAKAYSDRGASYAALSQHEAALADFTHALQIAPHDAHTYTNRGATYAALGQRETALADYTYALQLDPTFARAYYNRGNTYYALRQHEAALTDYNHALVLDPTNAKAYANIGALLGNQGRLAEALPYFEKAAQLGDPQSTQSAATVRQRLGLPPTPATDPTQATFTAFQQADSLATMQQAVTDFPLLRQPDFIAQIEQAIAQQVPPEHRPALIQRLTWLRQVVANQKPGFFSRLFNRGGR